MGKLDNKKIWIDIEEPKTGIIFDPLIKKLKKEGADILITARDFDSTFPILDALKIEYVKVGKHGGQLIEDKLQTYIDRLQGLMTIVKEYAPDFFITFSSVEGTRIAYGLQIPSIGYNDEPRNEHVCKLIFPYLDQIITPECIPIEDYINLYAKREKIIRYNGIDEIGWLSVYESKPEILKEYEIEKGKYVIIRSEMTSASYFVDKLETHSTVISEFFPKIFEAHPDFTYFLLVRSAGQKEYLERSLKDVYGDKFQALLDSKKIRITQFLPNFVDFCFYSALVISGGGTIVRESSLLGVPSIEFFPGISAPQEIFLIENGFPIVHLRDSEEIAQKSIDILSQTPSEDRFNMNFMKKIAKFDNPNTICLDNVLKRI